MSGERKVAEIRKELVVRIIDSAKQAVDGLIADLRTVANVEISNTAKFALFADFVFLNYHMVDRLAIREISAARDEFMDQLHDELIRNYGSLVINKSLAPSAQARVKSALSEQLARFMLRFADYEDMRVTADRSMKGTLFYEFGKVIAVELEQPDDQQVSTMASREAAASVKNLDARALIARLK
jgi:hypothetical protein